MDATDEQSSEADGGGRGDLRVFFAGQRTMLSWVRTGVALMGFGFVVARFGLFLKEMAVLRGAAEAGHGGISVWAGTALLAAGVAVNIVAAMRFGQFARDFDKGKPLKRTGIGPEIALAVALAAIGVAMAVYLTMVG